MNLSLSLYIYRERETSIPLLVGSLCVSRQHDLYDHFTIISRTTCSRTGFVKMLGAWAICMF